MSSLQIITTADGSHSLLNPDLEETYHSRHGAVQESRHVFIANGLEHWLQVTGKKELNLFEVGFGTGLNAWLTQQLATTRDLKVNYASVEAFPLLPDLWRQLNYAPGDPMFAQLHESPWDTDIVINDQFTLHKIKGKLEEIDMPDDVDLIYYDAFAPSKQPYLWDRAMLEKVCLPLKRAGVFVTYCAMGQLKRDLKSLGLTTETLPGPPGKKEMVRASLTSANTSVNFS